MGIKLKNSGFIIAAFILACALMALTFFAALDFVIYGPLVKVDTYFETGHFNNRMSSYSEILFEYIEKDYKNYANKSIEQKISSEELAKEKQTNEDALKQELEVINITYNEIIEEVKHTVYVNDSQLDNAKIINEKIEEKNKEKNDALEKTKKQYNRTEDQLKKELVKTKDESFLASKSNLEQFKEIDYYFKNIKTGEINTNISEAMDIKKYIDENAAFYIEFPLTVTKQLSTYEDINLNSSDLTGYIIINKERIKYTNYYSEYINFATIKNRVINELIAGSIALLIAIVLFVFAAKKEAVIGGRRNVIDLYVKIPLELRAIILVTWVASYIEIISDISREINIEDKIIFALINFIFLLFAMNNFIAILKMLRNIDLLTAQFKGTLLYKTGGMVIKVKRMLFDSFILKKTIAKVFVIIILSMIFGFTLTIVIEHEFIPFLIYNFIFIITIPMILLKKLKYFSTIVKGTEAIVSGNMNYTIEENGKDEFTTLAKNINNMKQGYKKALEDQIKSDRMKSELITNVSHDLKTPLTSIINYVNLLKKGDLSKEETADYIAILERKAERLKVLIEDLFEASKMSSGSVELNVEKVDVGSLLRQALGEFEEKMTKSNLHFKVNIPENKVYLQLDGKKIWRVFENLINNILKYSQDNTRVYIDIKEEENKVVVVMKNISSYEMDFNAEEIFERFVRGDKSRHTEGSGLGLAIAKSIVELHGGILKVQVDGDLFKVTIEFYKLV